MSVLGGDTDLDLFLASFPGLAGRPFVLEATDFEPLEEDEPESESEPDDESESESELEPESESLLLCAAISLSYARFFSRNMSFGALFRKARRSSVKAPSPIEVK